MKNVIKITVGLVLIFVILNVFWKLFIEEGIKASNVCVTNEAAKVRDFTEQAKKMATGQNRNDYVCDQDYESFSRLVSCWSDSKKANPISFLIYSNLPSVKKTIENTVSSHNSNCPNSQLAYPRF